VTPELEFFDPLGTDDEVKSWKDYMDDPSGLNSEPGSTPGLRPLLQGLHEAGVKLSYNQPAHGPQPQAANSCGLWCLLRCAAPELSPSEFARVFRE